MHYPVKKSFLDWYMALQPKPTSVAYLGSFDVNGSIRDLVSCTGFDIVPGLGVDVQIEPGVIPEEHKNKYELVVSISAFQFCPNPAKFMREIEDLLIPGGLMFLTACAWNCRFAHSSSAGGSDMIRMTEAGLRGLFQDQFDIYDLTQIEWNAHPDVVVVGIKKGSGNQSIP